MNNYYFQLYILTHSIIGRIIRVCIFAISFYLIYLSVDNLLNLKISLSLFALVLINELFIEHLARIKPLKDIANAKNLYIDCLTFKARKYFVQHKSSFDLANAISLSKEGKFLLNEIGGGKLGRSDIDKQELLRQADELVSYVGGKYITDVDLIASYILLSEQDTNFMQSKNLTNEDIVNLSFWVRTEFGLENFHVLRVKFMGQGIFDPLVYGWNYEVKKYTRDLTQEILNGGLFDISSVNDEQYDQMIVTLSKEKASNIILVGEPGVGKTTLVERFAYKSFLGDVPDILRGKRVYELLIDKFLSGVSNNGEIESRISQMLDDLSHSGNAVIFIQNIENIFGGGGIGFDMSGVLYEYLKNERVHFIGTATPSSFSTFVDNKPNIRDLFGVIDVKEVDSGKTLLLLIEKSQVLEKKNKIQITYSALKQIVLLSTTYYPERFYPGSAIMLLEEVVASSRIKKIKEVSEKQVFETVQSKTHVVLEEPDTKEKQILIGLEEKMHQRVIGQDEAVKAIADAVRRLRSGFENKNHPIGVFLFLGPTGVGKTETAKALAREYFGNEGSMIRFDMSEFQTQAQLDRFLGEKPGMEYVPNSLVEQVEKNPFSLILLDEFEKAHPSLLNLFLQVFDEGRLTDNKGKTVSFKNTIIIATSNAGSEMLREENTSKEKFVDYLLKNNKFTPELLNRFDEIVLFKNLNLDETKKVAKILVEESLSKIHDNQISVVVDDRVLEKIADEAFNEEFGARNIKRYIEENIEQYISRQILEGRVQKGKKYNLSVDDSGNLIII